MQVITKGLSVGACRESVSLWYYLGFDKKYEYGTLYDSGYPRQKFCGYIWRFKYLLKRKMWKSKYFWQDTLWTPFNRFIGCKLLGHRNIIKIDDEQMNDRYFCTNCYTRLGPTNFEKVKIK